MKANYLLLTSFILFGGQFLFGQINSSTGGGTVILPNVPPSNTNVGIGTNTPSQKLEVNGNVKGIKAIFSGLELNNESFPDWNGGLDASIIFSAGKVNPLFPSRRLFNMIDMSMASPYDRKLVRFNMADRSGKERFEISLYENTSTELAMYDNNLQEFFKVKDYGNVSGAYLQMGKPNTRVIIGGFVNDPIIGNRKFVVKGNSLTQGKVAIGGTDAQPFGNFPTFSGAINSVSNYNLFVKGGILTEEIRVSLATTWADYVFLQDYKMPTLPELEKQIQERGHLPKMPSAKEVSENGIELGEMAKMQQEKIEELTLYIIQINKELQELKSKSKN